MSLQSINLYKQLAKDRLFKKTINFDLKRIKLVLKKLNNPQNKLKNVINIIGSDGKYSVLTTLKYLIEANSQKTSTYISPSLRDIRERFWMGKNYLSYKKINETIKLIKRLKIPLTVFEVLTVIYIINASEKDNDYNLVEAGALFAKDSTNVFDFPKSQIIVNINKQHLNFLKKKTINEIIYQKVGFLNQSTTIYIGKQKKNVEKKIKFNLKKNKSKKKFSNTWALLKINKSYYYKDSTTNIKLNTKYIHSEGLLNNLCLGIKVALDLGIKKELIVKTIPKIKFLARIEYINKGKIFNKLFRNEKILIDGCSSEASAKNLANYLKKINLPKYAVWGMIKNKNPDLFIKQFKGVFKKIITLPIENENTTLSKDTLLKIAKKNNILAESANNLTGSFKKISSNEKKIICILGSLYLCGNFLNKN
jgi:dihydrofolate synthase/folylpolyglutamate synthase